jgi:hypothetical protein
LTLFGFHLGLRLVQHRTQSGSQGPHMGFQDHAIMVARHHMNVDPSRHELSPTILVVDEVSIVIYHPPTPQTVRVIVRWAEQGNASRIDLRPVPRQRAPKSLLDLFRPELGRRVIPRGRLAQTHAPLLDLPLHALARPGLDVLRTLALKALDLSREQAREKAMRYGWDACARDFMEIVQRAQEEFAETVGR